MGNNKSISIILFICALIIFLMLPLRNSVYSDDVAFGQSVRHLLSTGDLKVSEYTAASSISHITWGFLFAKVLGFSFTALNISVVVLLPILLISLYKLLTTLEIPPQRSFIFTLFFLAIPWIPFLTFTFMSDIPFLTLEVLTILFYVKYLKDTNIKYLAISLVFASIAFLARQLGLTLIFGVFASVLLNTKLSLAKAKIIILPFLIPLLTLILYQVWLSTPSNKTIPQYFYEIQTGEALKNFLPFTNISWGTRLFNLSIYMHRTINYANQAMGLMFPLILVLMISNIKQAGQLLKRNSKIIIFSTFVMALFYLLDVINFRKEYTAGFPLSIYEYESLLPIPWAHIWKFLVILSIPFWSTLLAKKIVDGKKINGQQIYLLITFLGILFMTIITFQSWDRYLLPLLPFLFVYLAEATKRFKLNKLISISIATLLLIDAVQMTKLRYDEAGILYKMGNEMVNRGVEPSTIDLNRDQNWDIWFYFEKGIEDQLKEVNGDKTKIVNYQRFPLPPKNIKYGIYTDRMIKYQKLNIDKNNATIIPFRSLFVSSKLTFINY